MWDGPVTALTLFYLVELLTYLDNPLYSVVIRMYKKVFSYFSNVDEYIINNFMSQSVQ